jgi:hypothetical protein
MVRGACAKLTLEFAPRAESDANTIFAYSFANGVNNLEYESSAVFNRSTVGIRSNVGHVLYELVWKIAVRTDKSVRKGHAKKHGDRMSSNGAQ